MCNFKSSQSITSSFPLPVVCVAHVEWNALVYAFSFKNNGNLSFFLSMFCIYERTRLFDNCIFFYYMVNLVDGIVKSLFSVLFIYLFILKFWRLMIAEFVVIHTQFYVLHLWSLLMTVSWLFWPASLSDWCSFSPTKTYWYNVNMGFMPTDGARAALELGGTMLGYYPVRVLPSKTAILPVNPTFLPRVWIINFLALSSCVNFKILWSCLLYWCFDDWNLTAVRGWTGNVCQDSLLYKYW